ncbi:MAG TPA: hypothetical protein VGC87_23170 [Pyrinomonadaceae bacterium]|jgi:NAD(P)H-dependent FMN reductase
MDVLNLLTGFLLGVPASIVGTYFYLRITNRAGNRHLRQLFNFGSDDVIFVFTHGGYVPQSILPRTSTEAFIAVNNLIGTLIKTGWKGPIRVRDTSHIDGHDKTKNLVIVTGPKSNSFASEVLSTIKQQAPSLLDFERISDNPEKWQILSDVYKCPSPSYDQEVSALEAGREIATQKLEDVAMIIKVSNPWNGANKVFIVAGVRGIGTWGAAEYLRKHADELYQKKSGSGRFKRDGDFAALLKVTYENYDIVRVELRQLIDIS